MNFPPDIDVSAKIAVGPTGISTCTLIMKGATAEYYSQNAWLYSDKLLFKFERAGLPVRASGNEIPAGHFGLDASS